jgi:hypothetical protein
LRLFITFTSDDCAVARAGKPTRDKSSVSVHGHGLPGLVPPLVLVMPPPLTLCCLVATLRLGIPGIRPAPRLVYPRTLYTDVNRLRLLAEWHKDSRNFLSQKYSGWMQISCHLLLPRASHV